MLIQQIFSPSHCSKYIPINTEYVCTKLLLVSCKKKLNLSITNLSLIYMNPARKYIFDISVRTFTILAFGNVLLR